MAAADDRWASDAINLDRIEIEEPGANSERLAAAIHAQLGDRPGAVPVYAISRALGIHEIREEPLRNLEGALITTPERGYGSILLNSLSSWKRRRFTLGHELDHFLDPWHRPTTPNGFECTRSDMGITSGNERHLRQEAEANRFSTELLMPPFRLRRFLRQAPSLAAVLAIASALEVSKEAAARRFVDLHEAQIAVVFSHDGRCRYSSSARGFPALALRQGTAMPWLPQPSGKLLAEPEEANPADWLSSPQAASLTVQTLYQRDGYAMTLLVAETDSDDVDDGGIEDAFIRVARSAR